MSLERPKIAVDIDDVLSQSAKGFVAYSNERWGTNLTVDDYDDHWAEMWKIDRKEAEKRAIEYHDANIVKDFLVYDGALEVLHKLAPDFELLIATSRRVSVETSTREWLDKHYEGVFNQVVFAGIFVDGESHEERWLTTKADIYTQYKVDYVIDDQLKHCLAAANLGIKALLFGDYAWNRSTEALPSEIIRVANWAEVGDYFARERV
jgi:uncharacterized HAD superfamily protein